MKIFHAALGFEIKNLKNIMTKIIYLSEIHIWNYYTCPESSKLQKNVECFTSKLMSMGHFEIYILKLI